MVGGSIVCIFVGFVSAAPPTRIYESLDELWDSADIVREDNRIDSLPLFYPPWPNFENLVFDLFSDDVSGAPCIQGYILNGDPIPRQRCFLIEFEHNLVYLMGSYSDYSRDIVLVPSTGNPRLQISRSQNRLPAEWVQFENVIGIGHGSDFSRTVRSMMMVPIDVADPAGSQFRLITRPTNPASYCFDSQIGTVFPDLSPDGNFLLSVDVELLDHISGTPISLNPEQETFAADVFHISTERLSFVPRSIRNTLSHMINTIGMFEGQRQNFFEHGCGSIIDQLPSIRFSIREADQVVVAILFRPEDYFTIHEETGECESRIDLIGLRDDQMSFGRHFLERVGIFIDYDNVSMGLCEPA